jgi:hypothetical protein
MDGTVQGSTSQTFLFTDPFWLQKVTTNPHILAQVDKSPNSRYPKLKNYIPEITSDTYKYISLTYITTHCMI